MKSLSAMTAVLPLVLTALVAGCTTMGTGFGSTASGQNPVNFNCRAATMCRAR